MPVRLKADYVDKRTCWANRNPGLLPRCGWPLQASCAPRFL